MFSNKKEREELRDALKKLKESQELKKIKYVAVTHYNGEVTSAYTRESMHGYGGYTSSDTMKKCDKTIILYGRDGTVDTMTLPGKWTIEQIKEAVNG